MLLLELTHTQMTGQFSRNKDIEKLFNQKNNDIEKYKQIVRLGRFKPSMTDRLLLFILSNVGQIYKNNIEVKRRNETVTWAICGAKE